MYIYILYVCIDIVDIVVEMIILHEVGIPIFITIFAEDMAD